MEQNEKARYKKWFPFTTYDLDELNNRDIVFCFLLSKSKINLEVMKKLLNIGTEIRVSIRDNIGSDEIEGEI